ncbi:3-hydroxyacyl-CoA dehydrogenase NAD-binding domain-containing protein [Verminephrobacter aporrectodeae]|uniref:3-hydroxyacyl-CoA dehydrogenase NAD-binding domain-containing protein n=1 Tax=Verminephrobacter aporrectodeae TaxID=1110389 RepID=UPI00224461D2|nr:3-hydroxyacyl-CoA dehydrogenase NAD-binding domain-containing protein [Verminephrobacter aporrectodeae]
MDSISPANARTVIVGGGTMGAGVAVVLARGGARVTGVELRAAHRERLLPHVRAALRP